MELKDLLKLGEMGFTKEDIMKMVAGNEPEKEPSQEPQNEPVTDDIPENEETPSNEEKSLSTGINALLEDMHKTLKGIQDANIQNSRMPEVKVKKPEDILADVIFPTFKKEG